VAANQIVVYFRVEEAVIGPKTSFSFNLWINKLCHSLLRHIWMLSHSSEDIFFRYQEFAFSRCFHGHDDWYYDCDVWCVMCCCVYLFNFVLFIRAYQKLQFDIFHTTGMWVYLFIMMYELKNNDIVSILDKLVGDT
jgi:hypothetical protein